MATIQLLVFTLLTTIVSFPGPGDAASCRRGFLFAVTQETNEAIGLSLLSKQRPTHVLSQTHIQLSVSGQLSLECGENFIRCKDPLMVTSQVNKTIIQFLIFIPLQEGLLIQEVVQTDTAANFGSNHILSTATLANEYRCTPVKAFVINFDYYLVCSDTQRSYISLHRIFLGEMILKQSTLSQTPIARFHDVNLQSLSNLVQVDEGIVVKMICFAIGESMYNFDIVAYSGDEFYGNVGNNCSSVKRLEYIGNSQLLAYCDFVNVYYNIENGDWQFQWWNSIDGVPYICPNRSVKLRVFTTVSGSYLQYKTNGLVGNIDLSGSVMQNGICFGALRGQTYFAYNDMQNVYVINMTDSRLTQLLTTSCTSSGCLSLDVVDNRYLVIHEQAQNGQANLKVLDAESNFSSLMTAEHFSPVLFRLVNNAASNCSNATVVPSMPTDRIVINQFDESLNTGTIAGAIAGVVLGILLCAAIATVIVVLVIIAKRWRHFPHQESLHGHSESTLKVLLGSPDEYNSEQQGIMRHAVYPQLSTGVQLHNSNHIPLLREPVTAKNTNCNEQQVGNSNSNPNSMREIHNNEDNGPSPMSEAATGASKLNSAATNWPVSDLLTPSCHDSPAKWMSRPVHARMSFADNEDLPKLAIFDNDVLEKGAAEVDNRSENSSLSSFGASDEQPLLAEPQD